MAARVGELGAASVARGSVLRGALSVAAFSAEGLTDLGLRCIGPPVSHHRAVRRRDERCCDGDGVPAAASDASAVARGGAERCPIDVDALAALGKRAGLSSIGVCRAEPFDDVRRVLLERKQAGLHAGMQFTYRNPQRSTEPARLLEGAAALIVGALDYSANGHDPPDVGEVSGRVAAYARAAHYDALRAALDAMAAPLRSAGYRAVVTADENSLVDRAAAHRAAVGWWGKSANILVPGSGSLVVLGAVVTDAALAVSDPEPLQDGCGPCRRCLDRCPTGAIIAPGTVDARRCLAWLLQDTGPFDPEYRVALADRIYGCDDCSEACPPSRVGIRLSTRGSRRRLTRAADADCAADAADDEPVPAMAQKNAWAPLLGMLQASDEELMRDFGHWYVPRRQPRYLRRNALVVLGNVGDGSDGRVRAAVESALADADPLVRAHAVWCARRLGIGLDALSGREDPWVRDELARDVPARASARAGRRVRRLSASS